MAQTKLDAQGRIQPRETASLARNKQTEPAKRATPAAEGRAPTNRPATRGAAADPGPLTHEEIKGLPGQEIKNAEEGKRYLEHTLLMVPGAPLSADALSTALFQVTQYKGIPRQAINAVRSVAFALERIQDDARSMRIVSIVKEGITAERMALADEIQEATTLLSKAATIAEEAARLSHRVVEDTAAVVTAIQAASTTVATSATQINETTTTYRDAVLKASTMPQQAQAPAGASALDVRVRARQGIKQRQVLVDAANMGDRVLAELDNAKLILRANEIIGSMGSDGSQAVVSARRLANGGVLLELNSEEAARWLNEARHRVLFTEALAPDARIKARLFPLVLQFLPLHF
jgi:hypothetical protein